MSDLLRIPNGIFGDQEVAMLTRFETKAAQIADLAWLACAPSGTLNVEWILDLLDESHEEFVREHGHTFYSSDKPYRLPRRPTARERFEEAAKRRLEYLGKAAADPRQASAS